MSCIRRSGHAAAHRMCCHAALPILKAFPNVDLRVSWSFGPAKSKKCSLSMPMPVRTPDDASRWSLRGTTIGSRGHVAVSKKRSRNAEKSVTMNAYHVDPCAQTQRKKETRKLAASCESCLAAYRETPVYFAVARCRDGKMFTTKRSFRQGHRGCRSHRRRSHHHHRRNRHRHRQHHHRSRQQGGRRSRRRHHLRRHHRHHRR